LEIPANFRFASCIELMKYDSWEPPKGSLERLQLQSRLKKEFNLKIGDTCKL